jgi:hypothetical protein
MPLLGTSQTHRQPAFLPRHDGADGHVAVMTYHPSVRINDGLTALDQKVHHGLVVGQPVVCMSVTSGGAVCTRFVPGHALSRYGPRNGVILLHYPGAVQGLPEVPGTGVPPCKGADYHAM